jgi:hypothetical protein
LAAHSEDRSNILSQLIRLTRYEYVKKGWACSYENINEGLCEDFAHEIRREFRSEDIQIICTRDFYTGAMTDSFDLSLLLKQGPIPDDFVKVDLSSLFNLYHVWLKYGTKHYDAEAPEGVECLLDLPFFGLHRGINRFAVSRD